MNQANYWKLGAFVMVGIGIAFAVTGGLLVLLAAGAYLVNRRWPLPDLVRRRRD